MYMISYEMQLDIMELDVGRREWFYPLEPSSRLPG